MNAVLRRRPLSRCDGRGLPCRHGRIGQVRSVRVVRERSAVCGLSRRGMGRARVRSARPVGEAGAGRVPGRAGVDHHPEKARDPARGLRRVRSGEGGAATARRTGRGCWPTPASSARGPRSTRPSAGRGSGWRCATGARTSPPGCGASWTARRSRTTGPISARRRPRRRSPQAMAKALKARGFKFCGPVIVYAFMQAVGMVNDHQTGCFRHGAVKAMARADVARSQSHAGSPVRRARLRGGRGRARAVGRAGVGGGGDPEPGRSARRSGRFQES